MSQKVLLIAHSSHDVEKTGKILKDRGYEVNLLNSGKKIIDYIKQYSPTLILLRTVLPEEDSYNLCRQLKNNVNTRFIPIIMIEAEGNKALNAVKAYEAGAEYYCCEDEQFDETLPVLIRLVFEKSLNRSFQKQQTPRYFMFI